MKKEYEIKEKIYHKSQEQTIFSAECYTILFILTGKCFCHYENHKQLCNTEDMILIKPGYKAVLSYSQGKAPLRLFRLVFSEPLLLRLSNEQMDLKASFRIAPLPCTCVHIFSDDAMMLKHISSRLLSSTKEQTNITVHKYITKSRLDLCRMLLEEGYSITEIYKVCGMGSYNHLFRSFKQEFGMTPKEYLQKKREDEGIL